MGRHTPTYRRDVGRFGESVAARFLVEHGLTIIERNVFIDGDELDLIVLEGTRRIVVEVKTSANGDDPMEAIDDVIRRAVRGYGLPVYRIDAIAVRLTPAGASVRWLKAVL